MRERRQVGREVQLQVGCACGAGAWPWGQGPRHACRNVDIDYYLAKPHTVRALATPAASRSADPSTASAHQSYYTYRNQADALWLGTAPHLESLNGTHARRSACSARTRAGPSPARHTGRKHRHGDWSPSRCAHRRRRRSPRAAARAAAPPPSRVLSPNPAATRSTGHSGAPAARPTAQCLEPGLGRRRRLSGTAVLPVARRQRRALIRSPRGTVPSAQVQRARRPRVAVDKSPLEVSNLYGTRRLPVGARAARALRADPRAGHAFSRLFARRHATA